MKLIYPPTPDPSILAAATAEATAAAEALAEATRVREAAYVRKQTADRLALIAQQPVSYAERFAALVADSKLPGCTLVAKPINKWNGETKEWDTVGSDIACLAPGKVQRNGRIVSGSGGTHDCTFYRRDGGRWATSRRQYDSGDWTEVAE